MNKLLKGSIAGAAGIALLLGGAGTLALWNDTETIAGGAITAGELDIDAGTSAGVWAVNDIDIVSPATIDDYRVVPGDIVTFTKVFDVTAVGDNLEATVALSNNAITAVGGTSA